MEEFTVPPGSQKPAIRNWQKDMILEAMGLADAPRPLRLPDGFDWAQAWEDLQAGRLAAAKKGKKDA